MTRAEVCARVRCSISRGLPIPETLVRPTSAPLHGIRWHFRDINAAVSMLRFGTPITDESVFKRLQDKGILDKDGSFSASG
ncbi:hypothetical protein BSLA_02r3535 [Burkholderia stabilis]|nr:hypothetical protein BSLA_02r3535 [Burkholderia stabilis]